MICSNEPCGRWPVNIKKYLFLFLMSRIMQFIEIKMIMMRTTLMIVDDDSDYAMRNLISSFEKFYQLSDFKMRLKLDIP